MSAGGGPPRFRGPPSFEGDYQSWPGHHFHPTADEDDAQAKRALDEIELIHLRLMAEMNGSDDGMVPFFEGHKLPRVIYDDTAFDLLRGSQDFPASEEESFRRSFSASNLSSSCNNLYEEVSTGSLYQSEGRRSHSSSFLTYDDHGEIIVPAQFAR